MKNKYLNKEYLTNFLKDFKLISDNHFGHKNAFFKFEPIRQTLNKNFDEFENKMIENINLSKTSSLLHLGDFCINKKNDNKTIENIDSTTRAISIKNKILIKGNHDKMEDQFYIDKGWDIVISKPIIFLNNEIIELNNNFAYTGCIITEIDGKRILFSHFGLFDNDPRYDNKFKPQIDYLYELYKKYDCELNVHGHSHGNKTHSKNSFNVSVENIKFQPISLKEIFNKIKG